jgi:hypothetical protein
VLGGSERTRPESGQTLNNMKAILASVIAGVGLSANAAILAGPFINPANGHSY